MSSEKRLNTADQAGLRPQRLPERLAHGDIVLLDGATGTELQRRNVPASLPLWSAQAMIERPSAVQQIHEEYVAAGADIITANTFRTTPRTLRQAGMSEADAGRLTHHAVLLAKAAAATSDRDILVAGSIAPLEDCYSPELTPPFDQALAEHRAQSAVLASAGVDMILVETMPTAREAEAAAIAATETGLGVAVSVVCGADGRLLSGETLAEAVHRLTHHGLVAMLVNCSTSDVILGALAELIELTDLPTGGYANVGVVDADTGWAPDLDLTPARYAQMVGKWVACGARIVGGCCGTTPAHIAAVRALLDTMTRKRP